MNNLEKQLYDLFVNKMPALPGNVKEAATKIVPWVILVFGVLGLFGWLASLQILFGIAGLSRYGGAFYHVLTIVHLIIAPIAAAFGIYGGYLMLSRQLKGWRLSFYGLLIGFISTLLSLSVIGLVLNFAFGYLLFQIKDNYTVAELR